jgi:hypothetical protein
VNSIRTLTRKQRELLRQLAARKTPALRLNLGDTPELKALLRNGYVEAADHPTVKDRRTGGMAMAIVLTDIGKAAL